MDDRELTDAEMDAIWNEARTDAIDGSSRAWPRYSDNQTKREFYEHAYRTNYAKENGN